MWGEAAPTEPLIYKDRDGREISYGYAAREIGKNKYKLNYTDMYGVEFENQTSKVITYPFADMPVVESTWQLKKTFINREIPQNKEIPLEVEMSKEGITLKEVANDFSCTTKTDEEPINTDVRDHIQELLDAISEKMDWAGDLAKEINKDNLFSYASDGLSSLVSMTGLPLEVELSPTKDPRCFHVMIVMGTTLAHKSSSKEVYTDKKGNVKDVYQGQTKDGLLVDDKYDTREHSNTEFTEKYGITNNGGTFTADHKDNSKTKNIFKKLWNKIDDKVADEAMSYERDAAKAKAQQNYTKKIGSASVTFGGCMYYEFRYGDDGKWEVVFYGGGMNAGIGVEFGFTKNFMIGPVPVNVSLNLGIGGSMGFDTTNTGKFEGISNRNNFLTTAQVKMTCEAFAGVGLDYGYVALKLGISGALGGTYTLKQLDGWNVNYKEKSLEHVNKSGTNVTVKGEVALKFKLKVLFLSYTWKLWSASHEFLNQSTGDYEEIVDFWGNAIGGVHSEPLDKTAKLCAIKEVSQESRSYLAFGDRKWTGGNSEKLAEDEMSLLKLMQSNTYSFAEPIYNDDGSMIAYLSDSVSSELKDTVASYAVRNGESYVNQHGIDPVTYKTDELNNETGARGADGKLDPICDDEGKVINKYRKTERTGYGDSTVRIAGTKDFSVAAWVRECGPLPDEKQENQSFEDLMVMMNQAEICASIWNGEKWTTCKLTDNNIGDVSPAVAVNGDYAVVAWRSCAGSDSNNPMDFNVLDEIHARVYNKQKDTWGETVTLYNGQTGSVHSLEISIMSDGTAMAAYVIKTGEDAQVMTDTEIMYTVINASGAVKESVRVTNDNNMDQNQQITNVNWNGEEHFILGWFNERESTELDVEGKAVPVRDIKLLAINSKGMPNSDFVESIHEAGAEINCANFRFSKPAKDATLDDLSIVWLSMCKEQSEEKKEDELAPKNTYVLSSVRFAEFNHKIMLSAPVEMVRMKTTETIDEFSSYSNQDMIQTVLQSTDYTIDPKDPKTYEVDTVEVLDETDGKKKTQNIYTPVGKSSMYTVTSKFNLCALETEDVYVDRNNVVMGFSTPIGFTVKNTGIRTIDRITLTLDGNPTEIDTKLLPGECQTISEYYKVPADTVKDVTYSITAHSGELASKEADCSGVVKLNLPDVSVRNVELTKEEDKERTVQVSLSNESQVPFKKGGKQIVVALYDRNPETSSEDLEPIDKLTVKENDDLALVDAHAYNCQFQLSKEKLEQLIQNRYSKKELENGSYEIPDKGLELFVKTWILEDSGEIQEEDYTGDNSGWVQIESLKKKYQSDYSISSRVEKLGDSVDAVVTVRNNSYAKKLNGNAVAILCDSKGNVMSKAKQTYDPANGEYAVVCVKEEESKDITIPFTAEDLLDGYKLEDAVSIKASFGAIDLGDQSAQLEQFGVKGQKVACDLFEPSYSKEIVTKQDKEIKVHGESVTKKVEVHTKYYGISNQLNSRQRKTFVSTVAKNPGDTLEIKVNSKLVAKGIGAQIVNANLINDYNSIQATVESTPMKQMDVVRKVVTKAKNGKQLTKKVKERYMLNQDGKPVDAEGGEIDLEAQDVVSYEEVYVLNQSVYSANLSLTGDVEEKAQKKEQSNQILLLKSKMLANKKGKVDACCLTWNAIKDADGYLVYGAKCDTSNKTYAFKRLAKMKGNKKLTFTQKSLKANQGYKYLVKAYRMKDGKQEIIARSYVVRSFAFQKDSQYANPTSIKIGKTTFTTKKGKSVKLEPRVVLPKRKKNKKQGAAIRYVSSDPSIATVTSSGKVVGRKKGSCYIYMIAQNGVWKKIKVWVK